MPSPTHRSLPPVLFMHVRNLCLSSLRQRTEPSPCWDLSRHIIFWEFWEMREGKGLQACSQVVAHRACAPDVFSWLLLVSRTASSTVTPIVPCADLQFRECAFSYILHCLEKCTSELPQDHDLKAHHNETWSTSHLDIPANTSKCNYLLVNSKIYSTKIHKKCRGKQGS